MGFKVADQVQKKENLTLKLLQRWSRKLDLLSECLAVYPCRGISLVPANPFMHTCALEMRVEAVETTAETSGLKA